MLRVVRRVAPRLCAAVVVVPLSSTCIATGWQDLCPPVDGRVAFLSRGDCVLTRDDVFAGHEWLTRFANEDIPDGAPRFTESEIGAIIEGNRRVDFPLELMVHLNNGLIPYISALTEYHDRVENQPIHFLLNDVNGSAEAAANSHELVRAKTREATSLWTTDRLRSLTLIGQVTHTVQDSYSAAHTHRDPEHAAAPWCVVKVKAYMPRAPGFMTDDIEFHGGKEGDTVGHATPQDSITRAGRDCRGPTDNARVRECLSDNAREGSAATREYLELVLGFVRAGAVDDAALDAFIAARLSLCPDAAGG